MHSVGGSQEKAVQPVSNMEGPHQVAGPLWKETHGKKSKASEHQADVQPHDSFQPKKS